MSALIFITKYFLKPHPIAYLQAEFFPAGGTQQQ